MLQKKIVLPERGAETLFDLQDENVHYLESLFKVRINARGGELSVEGEEESVAALESLIRDFSVLISQGHQFENGELRDAFQQIADGEVRSLRDFLPRKPILVTAVRQVVPRSMNQLRYVQAMEKFDMVFGIGPAGTGKTYLAMAMAVAYLLKKAVSRIILARPAVEAGEKLGFLPGDLQEKVNPYLRPLYDALFHMVEDQKVEKLIERGVIEIAPIAFMRGRTLSDSFIILDEAQNCTSEQMKMFLTRMGLNSKVVVTGDVTQIDLPRGQISGLVEAREILSSVPEISFCYFNERDVIRHRLVKQIIKAYDTRRDF
ncbi:MAG TPA: PhoH family protein [Acidobacteriota bacterium]|nr:PhoH family protein [Acidobacteriota bacterium]